MEKETEVKDFTVTDLYLVSYLKAFGFTFSRPPELVNHLVVYSFPKSTEIDKACNAYINKHKNCDAVGLFDAYKVVKQITWTIRKGGVYNGN